MNTYYPTAKEYKKRGWSDISPPPPFSLGARLLIFRIDSGWLNASALIAAWWTWWLSKLSAYTRIFSPSARRRRGENYAGSLLYDLRENKKKLIKKVKKNVSNALIPPPRRTPLPLIKILRFFIEFWHYFWVAEYFADLKCLCEKKIVLLRTGGRTPLPFFYAIFNGYIIKVL